MPVRFRPGFGDHLIVFLRDIVQIIRRRPRQFFRRVRRVVLRLRDNDFRQSGDIAAKQFFQRGAGFVAHFLFAQAHTVCIVGKLLLISVIPDVGGKLIERVIRIAIRQLAVGLAGQRLLNQAAVLIIAVRNLALTVGHARELIGRIIRHFQRHVLAVRPGNRLFQHVSGLVIGVAFAVARALQEAGQLSERVIRIAVFRLRSVFRALFARDVAVPVIAVTERNVACAAGGLLRQVAHAVIRIARGHVPGNRLDSSAHRVVDVACRFAIQPHNADHSVHRVIGIADRPAVRVGHGRFVAVCVVGIRNHVSIDILHGDQESLLIVLIANRSGFAGYLCELSDFVVAARDALPVSDVLTGQCARFVVFKRHHRAVRLGDAAQPALRRVGILHPVAQRVGFARQVSVLVVGVLRRMAQRVRHGEQIAVCIVAVRRRRAHRVGDCDDSAQQVIFNGRFAALDALSVLCY